MSARPPLALDELEQLAGLVSAFFDKLGLRETILLMAAAEAGSKGLVALAHPDNGAGVGLATAYLSHHGLDDPERRVITLLERAKVAQWLAGMAEEFDAGGWPPALASEADTVLGRHPAARSAVRLCFVAVLRTVSQAVERGEHDAAPVPGMEGRPH